MIVDVVFLHVIVINLIYYHPLEPVVNRFIDLQ